MLNDNGGKRAIAIATIAGAVASVIVQAVVAIIKIVTGSN